VEGASGQALITTPKKRRLRRGNHRACARKSQIAPLPNATYKRGLHVESLGNVSRLITAPAGMMNTGAGARRPRSREERLARGPIGKFDQRAGAYSICIPGKASPAGWRSRGLAEAAAET